LTRTLKPDELPTSRVGRIIDGEQNLNKSLTPWIGEITTGHGVAILASTLLAILSGTTTWVAGAPLLLAGIIGLVWPENKTQPTAAQATATGVVTEFNGDGSAPGTAPKPSARRRQPQ
jgi:hypothetical protein